MFGVACSGCCPNDRRSNVELAAGATSWMRMPSSLGITANGVAAAITPPPGIEPGSSA